MRIRKQFAKFTQCGDEIIGLHFFQQRTRAKKDHTLKRQNLQWSFTKLLLFTETVFSTEMWTPLQGLRIELCKALKWMPRQLRKFTASKCQKCQVQIVQRHCFQASNGLQAEARVWKLNRNTQKHFKKTQNDEDREKRWRKKKVKSPFKKSIIKECDKIELKYCKYFANCVFRRRSSFVFSLFLRTVSGRWSEVIDWPHLW